MPRRTAHDRRTGARALLFERLTDDQPHTQQEARPYRAYDVAGLEASLQRELERLFNTRCGPGPVRKGARRSVLGYGVPDHILDSPTSTRDQEALTADLAAAVRRFEPRLQGVSVGVHEADPRRQQLTVMIEGEIFVDRQPIAVRFPVVLGNADHEDSR